MSVILNIDTAVESGSVSLASSGNYLAVRANENTREHSAWIHQAIKDLLQQQGITLHELSAIAVTIGPGSYTGLRIGLSAAKGLCFALQKPLITVGTLEVMAAATINQASAGLISNDSLLCPLIDARRMEVYYAVYDQKLNQVVSPKALILDAHSFDDLLQKQPVIFAGNGSLKLRSMILHPHAVFADFVNSSAMDMASLSYEYYKKKIFADLSYSEPLYVKEFHSVTGK